MPDMDEFMEFLLENITKQMTEQQREREMDPAKYPYHVEITDDKALLLDAQYDNKVSEINRLRRRLEQEGHEMMALKTKLFLVLDELYPQIRGKNRKVSIKDVGDKRFYVGWDK